MQCQKHTITPDARNKATGRQRRVEVDAVVSIERGRVVREALLPTPRVAEAENFNFVLGYNPTGYPSTKFLAYVKLLAIASCVFFVMI